MAWYYQTPSHYRNQTWPRSLTHDCITMRYWLTTIHLSAHNGGGGVYEYTLIIVLKYIYNNPTPTPPPPRLFNRENQLRTAWNPGSAPAHTWFFNMDKRGISKFLSRSLHRSLLHENSMRIFVTGIGAWYQIWYTQTKKNSPLKTNDISDDNRPVFNGFNEYVNLMQKDVQKTRLNLCIYIL